jgi:transposase
VDAREPTASEKPHTKGHRYVGRWGERAEHRVSTECDRIEPQQPDGNCDAEQPLRLAAYLREHPALELIYRFKQRLCYLLLKKHRTRRQCEGLIPRFLRAVHQLRQAGLAQLVQLGHTLSAWSQEIVAMWRFTRNNGITEGFHNKMELINRQAYGFRNFENYRLRVKVLCG